MAGDLVSWPIEPLEQHSRGLGDRLGIAAPWLRKGIVRRALQAPPGSSIRRSFLTRAVRSGYAATNRDDYEMMRSALHPEVVFHPPGRGRAGLGFEAIYRGPEGVVEFVKQWKAGFSAFRYEPRELSDPGGYRFAVRLGMIGVMEGGVEVRDEYGVAIEFRDGLIFRQVSFYDWSQSLAALGAPDLGAGD